MVPGLERVLARRVWFVPDFSVWGLPSMGQQDFLITDEIDSVVSVYFDSADIGESDQEVLYSQLVDHRGNHLPASLDEPRVMLRHRGLPRSYVVGRESHDRFRVARDPESEGPDTVDLMVVELGQ